MADQIRRRFFLEVLREGVRAVTSFQKGMEESRRETERKAFFDSYESSYALTLAEKELIIETARQAGITTKHRNKIDIARELFDQNLKP